MNDAANKSKYGQAASEDLSYLKNPIWWAGMSTRALCLSVLCECELTADYQLSLEKVRILLVDMKLMLKILLYSRQLCSLYIRTAYSRHTVGSAECYHWVHSSYRPVFPNLTVSSARSLPLSSSTKPSATLDDWVAHYASWDPSLSSYTPHQTRTSTPLRNFYPSPSPQDSSCTASWSSSSPLS